MKWYVVVSERGLLSDGYYGWDTELHSPEQIYREDQLPRKVIFTDKIMVGRGSRPSVEEALGNLEGEKE